MMRVARLGTLLMSVMIGGFATTAAAAPVLVDLELIMSFDTSGSVDGADFTSRRAATAEIGRASCRERVCLAV